MNALQTSRPPLQPQPTEKRRTTPRPKRNLRQRSYQVMAMEATAKIAVNMVIASVAVSALTQLLPYHWLQQEKLRQISTEVNVMEGRVNNLQAEFSRNFDPRQTKTIMQQQTHKFDPSQRPIIIINQEHTPKQTE
ncbi:MAG TPA: hypothetical protein VK184_11065 [Nostocaceae cyanobacterium]|nr:hypothetical protein [Nostocaceae cyanobacterium]